MIQTPQRAEGLPNSAEVERAYLVIPTLAPELFPIAASLLPSDQVFYQERHQVIWQAMKECIISGRPLDWLTIQQEIDEMGKFELVGGVAYLAGMELDLPERGLKNVEKYAEILRGLWAKRRLIMMSTDLTEKCLNGNKAPEIIASAASALESISMDQSGADGPRMIRESLAEFDRWEPLPAGQLLGVTTGLIDLDRMLLGLQPGQQIVLAGRPAMGKTTLALSIARAAAMAGAKVLFFSLEMPEEQCRDRLLAMDSSVPLRSLLTGHLSKGYIAAVKATQERLSRLALWIDDRPALTTRQISSTAAIHQLRHGLDLIIVDLLGEIRYVGTKRQEVDQLGETSRSVRVIARTLKVPLLLLHQLNRKLEERSDKRPTMADLRGSGKIEEHADVIAFLYREEVYSDDPDARGLAEIIIAKQRQGEIGKVDAVFLGELTAFRNLDRHH